MFNKFKKYFLFPLCVIFISCVDENNKESDISISIVKNEIHRLNEKDELNNDILELNVTINFKNNSDNTLSIYLKSKQLSLNNEVNNLKSMLLFKMKNQSVLKNCIKDKIIEFEECNKIYDSLATNHFYRITGDKYHFEKKQIIDNSITLKSQEVKSINYKIIIDSTCFELNNLTKYLEEYPTNFSIELNTVIKKGELNFTNVNTNSPKSNFIKLTSKDKLLKIKQ